MTDKLVGVPLFCEGNTCIRVFADTMGHSA